MNAKSGIQPEGWKQHFESVPVSRELGFILRERSAATSTVEMSPRREFLQLEGVVQGGILSALADAAAVSCFYPDLDKAETTTSIELKMSFLRPALAGKGPILARAKAIHRGRKIGLAEVELLQDEKLIAKGSFTYLFYARSEP